MLYMFIRSRLMHEHVVRKRFLHEFTNIIHTLTVVQLCLHSGIVIHMLMQLPCRLSVQWQGYGVHDGVPPRYPPATRKYRTNFSCICQIKGLLRLARGAI